jgi:hypothetical protein
MKKLQKTWHSFTRDDKGRTIIWQWPNAPIIGWALFRLLGHFSNAGYLNNGFNFLGSAFLFVWAYLEITEGASYFRKSLGAAVIIAVIAGYFMN